MRIPEIQPFQFIRGTAFSERVQLANKVNEIIDGINQIGDIPDIQAQVDALSSTVSTIQAGLASTDADLDALTEQVNSLISEVNDTIRTQIAALQGEVSTLDSRMDTAETDISGLDSEVQGLLSEVIDSVAMSSTAHGTVQVQINHEDGSNDISQPIDLGLVEQGGITLISGTTDRSFKLHVDLTDGTAWETNDMIIPPGGGTEVTVTGITLHAGTSESYLQASIVLSDSTTIDSNDFAIVTTAQFTQLSSRVTTVEGTTAQHTTQISGLNGRVTALEEAGGYVLVPATASVLGGVKIGTGVTVASDGTISIPNASSSQNGLMSSADKAHLDAAATAATLMMTADASKVTLHLDSVSGSEFTEDIPQASQGGAGTIDHAKYQQIGTNQTNIAALQTKVNGLAPTVETNLEIDPPTITIGINGKTAQANLPTSGGEKWEELNLSSLPTDFSGTDRVEITLKSIRPIDTFKDWNEAPTLRSSPIIENNSFYRVEITPRGPSNGIISTLVGIELNVRFGPIALITLNPNGISQWNGTSSSDALFQIEIQAFTGAGVTGNEIRVSRSNITTYVTRMRRIKNYFT